MPYTKPKPDYCQDYTNDVVRMIEEGVAPFRKPWKAGELHTPYNTTSLRPYHGGNAFGLMIKMMKSGWDNPRFVTYHQAEEKGWQVRKGEKGTKIEYWEFPASKREADSSEGDDRKPFVIHRIYTVFNAAQVDGRPPLELSEPNEWETIEAGERVLANSGANIRHDGGDRAFYRPSSDSIHVPVKEALQRHFAASLGATGDLRSRATILRRTGCQRHYTYSPNRSASSG